MKTTLKKICDLKQDDIFIMDGVEYIVTNIHHALIFYIETSNRNGRTKFMAEMQLKLIEVYEH
jgi:hypothetical protein